MAAQRLEQGRAGHPERHRPQIAQAAVLGFRGQVQQLQQRFGEIAQRADHQAQGQGQPQGLWQGVADPLYPTGTHVLGDHVGGAEYHAQDEQVQRQPDVIANGNRRQVSGAVVTGHYRVDHPGADLGQLRDHHGPGQRQQGAALGQHGG